MIELDQYEAKTSRAVFVTGTGGGAESNPFQGNETLSRGSLSRTLGYTLQVAVSSSVSRSH